MWYILSRCLWKWNTIQAQPIFPIYYIMCTSHLAHHGPSEMRIVSCNLPNDPLRVRNQRGKEVRWAVEGHRADERKKQNLKETLFVWSPCIEESLCHFTSLSSFSWSPWSGCPSSPLSALRGWATSAISFPSVTQEGLFSSGTPDLTHLDRDQNRREGSSLDHKPLSVNR